MDILSKHITFVIPSFFPSKDEKKIRLKKKKEKRRGETLYRRMN